MAMEKNVKITIGKRESIDDFRTVFAPGVNVDCREYEELFNFAKSEIDRLKSEYEKLQQRLDKSLYCMKQKDDDIEILRAKCEDIKSKIVEFPDTPIACAEWLINKCHDASNNMVLNGYKIDEEIIDDCRKHENNLIKQIAEHLLVYCNHAED